MSERPSHSRSLPSIAVVIAAVAFAGIACTARSPGTYGDAVDGGTPQGSTPNEKATEGTEPKASATCNRYLSCLKAAQPEEYGDAVELYGKNSACWDSPSQSEGCDAACLSSFEGIAGYCDCSGDRCERCAAPLANEVYRTWRMGSGGALGELTELECVSNETDEEGQPMLLAAFTHVELRSPTVRLWHEDEKSLGAELAGAFVCGSAKLTGTFGTKSEPECTMSATIKNKNRDFARPQIDFELTLTCPTEIGEASCKVVGFALSF